MGENAMPARDPKKPPVLVTGSSGLIGGRLCEALADDYTVVGLDVKQPENLPPGAEWIKCDLTSDRGAESALEAVAKSVGKQIASVVHLAAYYDFSGEPSPLYEELTVNGTRRLLRGLHAMEVEQFVFSSSLLVMQPADDEGDVIDEKSSTQVEWDYPESKLAAEQVIAEIHGSIPAVILRIAGVYDENCNSIPISQQISRIFEQKFESHFFPGDPDHGQPFIHLDDLIECLHRVIDRRSTFEPLETFLVAEDQLMSYEQLQDRIGELLFGEQWTTIRIPNAMAKAGAWVQDKLSSEGSFIKPWMIDLADDHYPVDIRKLRERLNWEPKHRLHDTLEEMIRRLQEDPQRWYEINKLGDPPPDALGAVVINPVSRHRAPK
jgi:nucleoside-diphosphate-sugar epimerase